MQQTDAELVRGAIDGAPDACRLIVERHGAAVYNLAYRLLPQVGSAEDVAQESFRKAFGRFRSFASRRSLRAWRLRITHTTALEAPRTAPPARPRGAVGELEAALGRLRPAHRAALVLRYHEDLSDDDIAHVLGIRAATVPGFVRGARRELAGAFSSAVPPPEPRDPAIRRGR
jgi:RNA polymerase sigma-70 factor (ECF subfamily)